MVRTYVCAFVLVGLWNCVEALGQFSTIINAPPTVIGTSQTIGSDTQLNVFDGGSVGSAFRAGAADGSSTNVEVNVYDGMLGTSFDANSGSIVNVHGGTVSNGFLANTGSQVNILGGVGFGNFESASGSSVNVSGGRIGFDMKALSGSNVTLGGGSITAGFLAFSGSHVRVVGNDFCLNGVPIDGLEAIGSSMSAGLPANSVLSGTFADGTPFAFWAFDDFDYGSHSDVFQNGTLTLQSAALPAVGPAIITVPNDAAPFGIRGGQKLVVAPGGVVQNYFNAGPGSVLGVAGGNIGRGLEAVGAQVSISSGEIGERFKAVNNSIVNISGGKIRSTFYALESEVNLSGGLVQFDFFADRSSLNMTGGRISGRTVAGDGSIFKISGSELSTLSAESGSEVQIFADTTVRSMNALPGSVVSISGGSVDAISEAGSRSLFDPAELTIVNISGGSIGESFWAYRNSVINISGGMIGDNFHAWGLSKVNISGGTIGSPFVSQPFSEINIAGGEFGAISKFGGTTNISGGILSDRFLADPYSKINLSGTQFILNGVDITSSLLSGVPFTITVRDVSLTGLLADGSPFDFDLYSTTIAGEDRFDPTTILTVTLVPEPPSVGLLLVLIVGVCAKKIAFNRCGN